MSNKLYVGNLNYEVNSEDLREFFVPFGEIKEASVIIDRETGRSKGFGFVEFLSDESAEKVKLEANGKELKGRAESSRHAISLRSDWRECDAEPDMVSRPDGLPTRVARWPSRPGESQYDWEPPRTIKEAKERAAKLKAIGNAVSPIQAYHVGLWAREVLRI
jgi:hypothetical protein